MRRAGPQEPYAVTGAKRAEALRPGNTLPRQMFLLPPPAYGEGGHCTFAGRRVAKYGVFVILSQSGERPER
jgi:hypothetical protein